MSGWAVDVAVGDGRGVSVIVADGFNRASSVISATTVIAASVWAAMIFAAFSVSCAGDGVHSAGEQAVMSTTNTTTSRLSNDISFLIHICLLYYP